MENEKGKTFWESPGDEARFERYLKLCAECARRRQGQSLIMTAPKMEKRCGLSLISPVCSVADEAERRTWFLFEATRVARE